MIFISDLERNVEILLHPEAETKTRMDVVDAFVMYYKATLIPLILVILVEMLLSGYVAVTLGTLLAKIPFIGAIVGGILGLLASVLLVGATVMLVWIFIPVSLLIYALVYHVFGTYLFKLYKKDFSATATAVVYSAAPLILFFWVILIPVAGPLIYLIASGWSVIILLFSMANMQGITKTEVFWTVFGTGIIIGLFTFVLSLL